MRKCNICHIKSVISIRVPKMLVIQQKLRTNVMSSLNGNCGIKTSKNPLLHKSNKNTGKNCQNLLFRTLRINLNLQHPRVNLFIYLKSSLILFETVSFVALYLALFFPLLSSSTGLLKTQFTITVKMSSRATTGEDRPDVGLPSSIIFKKLLFLTTLEVLWKAQLTGLPLFHLLEFFWWN